MPHSSSICSEVLPAFGSLIRVAEADDDDITKPATSSGKLMCNNMKRSVTHISGRDNKTMSPIKNDDNREETGVWWWVNKNGFPLDEITWDRMWEHVAKLHPDGYKMVKSIREKAEHPQVPYIAAPMNFSPLVSVAERLEKIQNYMNALQYNHTGTQFFEIRKNRPIAGLMEVAKDMVKESLPIKCLEAIILGIFLTNGMMGLERFTISFKTAFNGHIHRHVVLGVYYSGRYGALGLSRREDLMYKPLIYKCLSDVIIDFEQSYHKYWHEMKKIKLGLPVPHDPHSYEFIQWKSLILNRCKLNQKEMARDVDIHSKEIRTKARSWSVPQSSSPRKSHSFIDMDSVRHSRSHATSSSTRSSLTQAIRVYQGSNSTPENSGKKREPTDVGEYQIRI